MPDFTPPRLETARLLLTWPTSSQIDEYHDAIIDTNMFDTIIWEGPANPQELHDWWKENRSLDPADHRLHFNVALIETSTNRYVGGASLRPVDRDPAIIDIGYALAPAFHGRGFATEAVRALVDEAFTHRGAERIFGNAFVGNHASRRVMEKVGFSAEGTQRRTICKRGTWIDQWMIAITRPDWAARSDATVS